jgi:hypothetical protein
MSVHSPWLIGDHDFPARDSFDSKARFLLRYAILAPSKHNVQPWTFSVSGHTIGVRADVERWQVSEGAELRELFLSLGCALENLSIAAAYFGVACSIEPRSGPPDLVVEAVLRPATERSWRPHLTELFAAIPRRHTARNRFGDRPVFATRRERLEQVGLEPGCSLFLTGDTEIKRALELIAGDAVQTHFPRLPLAESAAGHDAWRVPDETPTLATAPLIGIVSTTTDDAFAQIQAGQVFERLFLTTTSLSLDLKPMSIILQRPELRARVAALLPDASAFPQIVVKIGSPGPDEWEHTARRPLLDVD